MMAARAGITTVEAITSLTASAAVRKLIVENGNAPLRLPVLFAQMQQRYPSLIKSKTHFKRKIVQQMFKRGQLIGDKVSEDRKGREVKHYGMRLKNNRSNRTLVMGEGGMLPRSGRRLVVSAPEGVAPAASAPLA